jgi:hypothetical protein
MNSLARGQSAFEVHAAAAAVQRTGPDTRLRLLPSGDGWSLMAPAGELVFSALGARGRRQCLEFARARGVLAVFS